MPIIGPFGVVVDPKQMAEAVGLSSDFVAIADDIKFLVDSPMSVVRDGMGNITKFISTVSIETPPSSFRAGPNVKFSDGAGFPFFTGEAFDNESFLFTLNALFESQEEYDAAEPGDGILSPARFNMLPARWQDTIPFEFQVLSGNKTTFPYVTETNLNIRQIKLRLDSPVTNVRLVIEKLQADFVTWLTVWENVQDIPNKGWSGGYDFTTGENIVDLPIVTLGRSQEIFRATLETDEAELPLLGVITDLGLGSAFYPFLMIFAQDWFFTDVPNEYDVAQDNSGKFEVNSVLNTLGDITRTTELAEIDGADDQPDFSIDNVPPERDWGFKFTQSGEDATFQSLTFKSLDAHTNVQCTIDGINLSGSEFEPIVTTIDVVVGDNTVTFPQEAILKDGQEYNLSLFNFDGNNDTDAGIGLKRGVAFESQPYFVYRVKPLKKEPLVEEAPEDNKLYSRKNRLWVRDNAADTTFDPSSLCVNSTNVQAAIDDTTRSTTVIVKELSDFPTPVSNVITLDIGKEYIINGTVDLGINTIKISQDTTIQGINLFLDRLTTNSASPLIASLERLFMQRLRLNNDNGDIFNFSGSGTKVFAINEVVIESCASIGTIDQPEGFLMNNCAVLATTSGGLTFTGASNVMIIGSVVFESWTGTAIDLNTSTWDELVIGSGNVFTTASGSTAISGLVNDGNINVGHQGIITGNLFSGAGTFINNITECDNRWLFMGNENVEGTKIGVSMTITEGNEATTTINTIDVPESVNGTFTEITNCKFTTTSGGLMTYTGEANTRVSVIAKYLTDPAFGTNITYTGHIIKNGLTLVPMSRDVIEVDNANPFKMLCIADIPLVQNDTLQLVIENNTNTNNVKALALTIIISEG